jgi:hypothetical protein
MNTLPKISIILPSLNQIRFPPERFNSILQRNRSGGNQENELHGIGWNHYEQAVVIDFIANNSE